MEADSVRPILGFCVAKRSREERCLPSVSSTSPCTPKSPLTEALRGCRSFNLPSLKIRHRRSHSEGSEGSQITLNDGCEQEGGIPIPDTRKSNFSSGSFASSSGNFVAPVEARRSTYENVDVDEDVEEVIELGEQDMFELEVPLASHSHLKKLKQIKIKVTEGPGRPS